MHERAGRYAGFCQPGSRLAARPDRTAISLGDALPHPSSGLPDTSAISLIGVCLTLLRARFTQRARSLGPLVVSYTTVSPLPRHPKMPWRSALCCTFSRITPGGCYPPPCSAEPGRSSARAPARRRGARDATVWPARSPPQDSGTAGLGVTGPIRPCARGSRSSRGRAARHRERRRAPHPDRSR